MTAVLIAMLIGCEPAATDAEFGDQVTDAGGTGGDATAGPDVKAATGMTGQWLIAVDWSTCVSFGAAPFELRTRKLLLSDITHKGHKVLEKRQVCTVENTNLIGLKTVVPKPVAQGPGVLDVKGSVMGQGEGAAYSSGAEVQLWGAKLSDPLADLMPTTSDASNPALADTDNDGKPGATLVVPKICEIYVTQRAIASLIGTFDKDGRIVGKGQHTTEQHVLKATKPICAQKYTTSPNDPHNNFVMQRADSVAGADANKDGKVDCEEIAKIQSKLIKWAQADHDRCPQP